jgi:hypothetical protein
MWRDFRRAIGDRHVSEVLASYVEREVASWHAVRLASETDLSGGELLAAIERAAELRVSISRIADRLESVRSRGT